MTPYLTFQSKISHKLKTAEDKLNDAGYTVVRHVIGAPANKVFGLEVFGDTLYHLEKVRAVVGHLRNIKLVLNIQMQTILIR